ncbi:MAG: aldehyde dehydrogenase family protein [Microbacterium sp.]
MGTLSRATISRYAVGSLGTGGFGTLPGLVLTCYLTDNLGVAALTAGVIVTIAKVWDVVIAPVVGALSDADLARHGSRRRLMLVGAVSLPVLFALTFAAPPALGPVAGAIWVLVAFLLMATAFSLFQVPYITVPAEPTDRYDERTRLLTWRVVVLTFAILLFGAGGPLLRKETGDPTSGHLLMGIVAGLAIGLGMLVSSFVTGRRTRPPVDRAGLADAVPPGGTAATPGGIRDDFRAAGEVLGRSQPFRALLLTFVLQALATGLMLAGILFAIAALATIGALWAPGDWISVAVAGVAYAGMQSLHRVGRSWSPFGRGISPVTRRHIRMRPRRNRGRSRPVVLGRGILRVARDRTRRLPRPNHRRGARRKLKHSHRRRERSRIRSSKESAVTPTVKTHPVSKTAPKTATIALPDPVRADLDAAIGQLQTGARAWSALTRGQRCTLMRRLRATTAAVAEEWADVAATSKGLAPGHPLRGEEWLSGPYAALVALDAYADTLAALAADESPIARARCTHAPGDRTVIHTSPLTATDALLLSGYSTEVWLAPGVSPEQARREAGLGQLDPTRSGGVGLVLGAGNITSIPFLDVLYELLAFNRVVILKVNPTQDALVPIFERALAPLIEPGFLRIVRGDGEIGAYLTRHPSIAHVHITGAEATFRAIVWGTGAAGKRRLRERRPLLRTPISAELGGVSPIIVVPGDWSRADLRFQAEHVVTMRLHNSGHNCIAGQVVVLSVDWPQREAFLHELRTAYDRAPSRPVWYPNSQARLDAARADYPDAAWCGAGTRALVETAASDARALESTEYFAPVLGVVTLRGTGQEFLDAAVAHANESLVGTLGANVLIDPATQAALGGAFEQAIADLRYGTIAINAWTAFGFLTPTATWGAFPGGTIDDAPSGMGVVHNAFLLDHVERTLVRGPFRPFPRSVRSAVRGAGLSVLPKPPWFVTSRTGTAVCEGFTRFRIDGDWAKMSLVLAKAFGA